MRARRAAERLALVEDGVGQVIALGDEERATATAAAASYPNSRA
jgi:hypothetical protein